MTPKCTVEGNGEPFDEDGARPSAANFNYYDGDAAAATTTATTAAADKAEIKEEITWPYNAGPRCSRESQTLSRSWLMDGRVLLL